MSYMPSSRSVMKAFRIWSKAWVDHGIWEGFSKAEALCKMHNDAGVDVQVVEGDLVFSDAEQRSIAGDVCNWDFEEVSI